MEWKLRTKVYRVMGETISEKIIVAKQETIDTNGANYTRIWLTWTNTSEESLPNVVSHFTDQGADISTQSSNLTGKRYDNYYLDKNEAAQALIEKLELQRQNMIKKYDDALQKAKEEWLNE